MTIITVKTGGIAADAVTDAKIADDIVGTEHLTANEVDTAALAADAVTGAQLADDAVNSEHYTDGSIDTAHIAADQIVASLIADDAISEEHLDVTAITGHTAETSVADGELVVVHDASASALRKMTVANLVANAGGGKVLQVLNDTATSAVATTAGTGTFVDTGLSQAITPSASSSKILCIGSIFHIRKNGDTSVNFRLIRGSTTIITPMGNYDTGDGQQLTETFNFQFLDSPNTTSAVTYKIQYSSGNANIGADTCPAQFTLMEIGA